MVVAAGAPSGVLWGVYSCLCRLMGSSWAAPKIAKQTVVYSGILFLGVKDLGTLHANISFLAQIFSSSCTLVTLDWCFCVWRKLLFLLSLSHLSHTSSDLWPPCLPFDISTLVMFLCNHGSASKQQLVWYVCILIKKEIKLLAPCYTHEYIFYYYICVYDTCNRTTQQLY